MRALPVAGVEHLLLPMRRRASFFARTKSGTSARRKPEAHHSAPSASGTMIASRPDALAGPAISVKAIFRRLPPKSSVPEVASRMLRSGLPNRLRNSHAMTRRFCAIQGAFWRHQDLCKPRRGRSAIDRRYSMGRSPRRPEDHTAPSIVAPQCGFSMMPSLRRGANASRRLSEPAQSHGSGPQCSF